MTTGVGASKFLGMQKIFAQIFPNLPKHCRATFVDRIFVRPPKDGLHLFFCKHWAPFLPRFEEILRKCSEIYSIWKFSRIFNKSKLLGVCLHPLHYRLLHHCQWRLQH